MEIKKSLQGGEGGHRVCAPADTAILNRRWCLVVSLWELRSKRRGPVVISHRLSYLWSSVSHTLVVS